MDKSFLITTGNQHQYVYSDALCYFLYVPEEMATVMEHMDASLVDLSQRLPRCQRAYPLKRCLKCWDTQLSKPFDNLIYHKKNKIKSGIKLISINY